MPVHSELLIHDFSCQVNLGCTQKEQAIPQEIRVSLKIEFLEPPAGCQTDQLKDTICYHGICDAIKEFCQSQSFQTIEFISYQLHQLVKTRIGEGTRIALTIHKVNPPIDGLKGGTSFVVRDE